MSILIGFPPHAPRLYDSNILIDFLKQIPAASLLVNSSPDRHISVITWIEVLAGAEPHDESRVRRFLSTFQVLPIEAEVMEHTALLRRSTRLKLPDALILATAHTAGRILVTRNTRDFPPSPAIHHPYQL